MNTNYLKMPLYQKAKELQELVIQIVNLAKQINPNSNTSNNTQINAHYLEYLMQNAITIPSKIAGAADKDCPYDLKMENATLIRKAAKSIITDLRGIEMYGFKDVEYLDLLRSRIDEFRVLFAEWVKTFDCWNYHIDRWGLFNPPGINYDDTDVDEDLPNW